MKRERDEDEGVGEEGEDERVSALCMLRRMRGREGKLNAHSSSTIVVPCLDSSTIRLSSSPWMTWPVGLCGLEAKSAVMPCSRTSSSRWSTLRW